MKKLFYIILVIAILSALGFFAKQYLANQEPELVVVEEEILPPMPEENIEIEAIENEAIDVVETNPEETADEDETEIEVNNEDVVESTPEETSNEGETIVE